MNQKPEPLSKIFSSRVASNFLASARRDEEAVAHATATKSQRSGAGKLPQPEGIRPILADRGVASDSEYPEDTPSSSLLVPAEDWTVSRPKVFSRGVLVSIIIPTYNAEKYIRGAVDSALEQTYEHVEVIVIDDGSTDGTKKALEPYMLGKKINYMYQENKGLAGARNTGVKNSKGEYVAFLDADDLFLPKKVAEQVGILEEHKDFDVCYSDLTHFTEEEPLAFVSSSVAYSTEAAASAAKAGKTTAGKKAMAGKRKFYHHRYHYPSGNLFEPLLHKQFVNPLTVFVRRSVFDTYGFFDETLRRSEDWDLWLRWSHAGVKFFYLDKPLAYYRIQSTGNLSSVDSEPKMKETTFFIFLNIGKKLSKEEWQKYDFSSILTKLHLKTAMAYLMVGDKKSALRWAIELPSFWRFLISIIPAGVSRFLLVSVRRLKHRLLLKKI